MRKATILDGRVLQYDTYTRAGRILADAIYHFSQDDLDDPSVPPRAGVLVDFVPVIGLRNRNARHVRVRPREGAEDSR